VVATSAGKVVELDSKTMEQLTADKRRGKTLVQGFDDEVHALDAHPSLPLFAVGTLRGSLQLWDIDERRMVAYRKFAVGEASSNSSSSASSGSNTRIQGSGGKKTDVSATLTSASLAAKGPPPKDELINNSAAISCVKFGPGAMGGAAVGAAAGSAAGQSGSSGSGTLLALGFSNGFMKIVAVAEGGGGGGGGDARVSSGVGAIEASTGAAGSLKDVVSFHRSEQSITSLVFSRDGSWLASSDAQGCVALYRYWHKDEVAPSSSSADAKSAPAAAAFEWIYVGKYRAHYRPIISLFFEEQQPASSSSASGAKGATSPSETDARGYNPLSPNLTRTAAHTSSSSSSSAAGASLPPRLFSLGEDRVLQEYDLASSSIRAGLKISSSTRLEQTACPTAMMSLPGRMAPGSAPGGKRSPDLIITANDEFKLKVWELTTPAGGAAAGTAATAGKPGLGYRPGTKLPLRAGGRPGARGMPLEADPTLGMSPSELEEHNRSLKCRKTLLAPLYGGALNKLFSLPRRDVSQRGSPIVPSEFLVYSTFDKLVGLIRLPLDGAPTKSMALIAHPGEVAQVVSSFDGKYLLTAGGADRAVNLFAVATPALEASIALGGKGIDPFLSLIDGGREGALYQELLDYFTYAQLRSQGLATTSERRISGYISVDEAVALMRALGFYPTEQQVVAMKAEVRYENAMLAEARAATAAQQAAAKSSSRPGTSHAAASAATAEALAAARSPDLLSLDEFLKLYVNHRPVFGLGARAFEAAFASLGGRPQRGLAISSEQLVQHLLTLGEEPMSAAELAHCLDSLLGERFVPEDAVGEEALADRTDLPLPIRKILARLPAFIEPGRFAQDILGFEDYASATASGATPQQQQRGAPSFADEADADERTAAEEEKEQPSTGKHTNIVISHAQ